MFMNLPSYKLMCLKQVIIIIKIIAFGIGMALILIIRKTIIVYFALEPRFVLR